MITSRNGSTSDHLSIAETEVIHLSTADLDPRLFEVPAGFTLVSRFVRSPLLLY